MSLPPVPKVTMFIKAWLTQEGRYVYLCPTCRVDVEEKDIEDHECPPVKLMTIEDALAAKATRKATTCG